MAAPRSGTVATGEKHRSWNVAEEQHRVDVVAVQPHAEVQCARWCVPTHIDDPELLPGRDHFTRDQFGCNRFERRHETPRVFDREQRAIHHCAAEGDDALSRCGHRRSDRCAEIDSAVSSAVQVGGSAVRCHDRARSRERPTPSNFVG